MKRTGAFLAVVIGALLVGCRTSPPPDYGHLRQDDAVTRRLERGLDTVGSQVQGDVGSLNHTFDLVSRRASRDAARTWDSVTGFPAWVARDIDEGAEDVARDLRQVGMGVEASVYRFPAELKRFLFLLW
jgi:hypothetical protein